MPPDSAPPDVIHQIAGSEALLHWFGFWPSFHDAEILSLDLKRSGDSCIRIHTWEMTPEIDVNRFYVLRKHVVVSFYLTGLSDVELAGFSSQNVISGLTIEALTGGLQLHLYPCYGVAGTLNAGAIRIEIQPGEPEDADKQVNPDTSMQ